jgi:VWFA-related protein
MIDSPNEKTQGKVTTNRRFTRAKCLPVALAALLVVALPQCFFAQSGGDPATAGSAASSAAAPPGAKDESKQTTIRTRVEVVSVPVSVLDKRGFPVLDLSQNDFRVYENGKLQAIKYFNRVPAPPLDIGLVIDTSNSARMQLEFEKEAASEFAFNMLQNRNSRNKIFLQTFDSTSSIIEDFTSDPDALNDKIRDLKAGGGKAFYDAIYFACKSKLMSAGPEDYTRRVLVVISDGVDVESKHTFDEALSMAHRSQTTIYTIGNVPYGFNNPGEPRLKQLAEDTGGEAFFPLEKSTGAGYLAHGQMDNLEQNKGLGAETGAYSAGRLIKIADALQDLGRQLDNQYDIGYTPENPSLDGTYRSIRVVTVRKGVQVLAKPGYFAVPQQTADQPQPQSQ